MAARTPRRSFATPLVITLAAAPACYVESKPAAEPAPPPTQPAPVQAEPAHAPPGVVANPPRPQPQSASANTRWTVYKANDGTAGCMAAVKVDCPAGAMCNPPPPFKYDCPPNVSVDPSITVVSNADGSACFVDYGPMNCPPKAACNPPRPTQVACPTR